MRIAFAFFCAPLFAEVIRSANSVMELIVLAAAAVAALGILWAKLVVPLVHLSQALGEGIEIVRRLPAYHERVETRLEVIEGALYGMGVIELPVRRRGDAVRQIRNDN